MSKQEPGDVTRIYEGDVSPGVRYDRKRTILDPDRVFVRIDGKEVSLAEVFARLGGVGTELPK